jgi:DNA replication and repair protein RecF
VATSGRDRVLVNKQRLRRTSDLPGVGRVTVFSPDDLALVKEGPALRRRFLDQTAMSLHSRADADRRELERILKHKSTLLKQVGGRLGEDAAFTLDVWNVKLAEVGSASAAPVRAGRRAVHRSGAYTDLADGGSAADVEVRYEPPAGTGLAEALAAAKVDEVRRQVCLVGPHRTTRCG